MKIYRNIYLKDHSKIPYKIMTGMNYLYYSGRVYYNVKMTPIEYDKSKDIYFTCDCDIKEFKKFIKK
jgi:hypothetical protein